ncbi:MAG: signal peptidase I [Candidatus Yanofskybacteria bacterium RIFCSPLOWO2_01_FULL_49_17]|uniref:Signal peptidase I n=1 Tax=Candidatus Yanofskybacteria bacterium RIFCSPLOWO2_01_FULL_49_17 TaxID=1802700 RepID=A0A1F8GRI4_9BACT|nr:MAG: signal peptidase I [Candidatus Yanofskybacteria bacterium RIFCSPLOWO2_01_FULL_49_17]
MPSEPSLRQELGAFVWETIKIVVISLVIIFPIRYYLLQPFFVKGASMESTLEDGDYIFIDELSYQFNDPRRGDVVVFRYPLDQSQFFIKRVIGLPGETLEIKNNQVIIYNKIHPKGQVLPEPYLEPGQQTLGQMRIKLDDNEYFVLGDNRAKSSDSRRWGAVNRSLITGRAFIRLWPLNDGIRVPHISYPI